MKLCDTCIYRNNVEQLKPCIIYRDNCEYYEKERGDMTTEEAIQKVSIGLLNGAIDCDDSDYYKAIKVLLNSIAHSMSIKALEQEPSGETVSLGVFKQVMWERDIAIEQLKELGYGFGQKIEPCDDAISRQAVLDIIDSDWKYEGMEHYINDLPSVNPQEPKTGLGDILIADQCECEDCIHHEMCKWKEERHGQECAYMQEPKTGHWSHDGSH